MGNRRVVLIVIDGLRVDGLRTARTPHLDRIMADSACSPAARTVFPPLTLPVHISLFASLPPDRHGVTDNAPGRRPAAGTYGIMDLARYADLRTAAFHGWPPLKRASLPGAVGYDRCLVEPDGAAAPDHRIAEAAASHLTRHAPDFCFIHLDGVDAAGHAAGFGSTAYLDAVSRADAAVGVILKALGADDHILVTADHGGEGWDHILPFPSVMTVPWMVAGPDIRAGFAIEAPVSLLDTAPTLARLLGIRPHFLWEGRVPAGIFRGDDLLFRSSMD